MKLTSKTFLILILIFANYSVADEVSSKAFTIEEVIKEVWKHSPQIKGQEVQVKLASADRWRRFLINEPQLQFSNGDDNSSNSFGLSLTTGFPGKAFALRSVDEAKEDAQRLELSSKKYDLARLILQSYLDCATAQAFVELQKTTSADLELIYKSLKSAYEAGHSTQAEKIGAELLSRQAHLDLVTADDKKETLCSKFNSVFYKAADGHSVTIIDKNASMLLPEDIDDSIISELGPATADQNRSQASLQTARTTLENSTWSQLPDLTLSVNRNHYSNIQSSPTGNAWTTSYSVLITLPLFYPFHESNEVNRIKSQALIDQNAAELQKVTSMADRLDGAKEYRRSRTRLTELRNTDLIMAEALVESTTSAYRAGRLGYSELILSRKTLADIRNQEIQLRASIITSHLRCLLDCEMTEPSKVIKENL